MFGAVAIDDGEGVVLHPGGSGKVDEVDSDTLDTVDGGVGLT